MASSKKTLELDLLSLKALNFKNTSNQNIISSLVLSAVGNGTTTFTSISSIVGNPYDKISVPGQATISSSLVNTTLTLSSIYSDLVLSTNASNIVFFNITTFPSLVSTLQYTGNSNSISMSTIDSAVTLVNTGTAVFSSLQLNLSNYKRFINPNGSTRAFLDFYSYLQFPTVVTPSSISSFSLYPDGTNNIVKNYIPISTNIQYYDNSNIIRTMSNTFNYMNVTSIYPYSVSTNTRVLSNTFNMPIKLELNTVLLSSLNNPSIFLDHYMIDAVAFKSNAPLFNNVGRSGFETRSVTILPQNLFLTINNIAPSRF
jgi:hypothetical protein